MTWPGRTPPLYVGGMGARGRNFYNALVGRYGWEAEAERPSRTCTWRASKNDAAAAVPAELLEKTSLIGPPGVRARAHRRLPGERA